MTSLLYAALANLTARIQGFEVGQEHLNRDQPEIELGANPVPAKKSPAKDQLPDAELPLLDREAGTINDQDPKAGC